jgi:hypothetical protein
VLSITVDAYSLWKIRKKLIKQGGIRMEIYGECFTNLEMPDRTRSVRISGEFELREEQLQGAPKRVRWGEMGK